MEVVTALQKVGALFRLKDYGHKYPYNWRTKKPTIFWVTSQWFASVERFRDEVLTAGGVRGAVPAAHDGGAVVRRPGRRA